MVKLVLCKLQILNMILERWVWCCIQYKKFVIVLDWDHVALLKESFYKWTIHNPRVENKRGDMMLPMCILLVIYNFLSKFVTTFFMILAAFSETRVHDIYPQVQEALQHNWSYHRFLLQLYLPNHVESTKECAKWWNKGNTSRWYVHLEFIPNVSISWTSAQSSMGSAINTWIF